MSPDDLSLELSEAQAHAPVELAQVMVNVDGRWASILGVSWDEEVGVLLIETD